MGFVYSEMVGARGLRTRCAMGSHNPTNMWSVRSVTLGAGFELPLPPNPATEIVQSLRSSISPQPIRYK